MKKLIETLFGTLLVFCIGFGCIGCNGSDSKESNATEVSTIAEVTTTTEATTTTEQTTTTEETTTTEATTTEETLIFQGNKVEGEILDKKIFDEPLVLIDNKDIKACITSMYLNNYENEAFVILFYSVQNKLENKYMTVHIDDIYVGDSKTNGTYFSDTIYPGKTNKSESDILYCPELNGVTSFDGIMEISGGLRVYKHSDPATFSGYGDVIAFSVDLSNPSASDSGKVETVEDSKVEEPKTENSLEIGCKDTSEDWEITLTKAYTSKRLESSKSRLYSDADAGIAFLILEFDVECLNSSRKTIGGDAITDLVAIVNGNDYGDWEYEYIAGDMWLDMENNYLDAYIPAHAYVYTYIPEKYMNDAITVKLKLAGKEYELSIN